MKKNIFFCPLQEVVQDLERKWSFQILYEIGNHMEMRFSELQKELRQISPKTLSDTLTQLENVVVIKKIYKNTPKKTVTYKLTKDGKNLYPIILDLLQWSISRKKSTVKNCLCDSKPKIIS